MRTQIGEHSGGQPFRCYPYVIMMIVIAQSKMDVLNENRVNFFPSSNLTVSQQKRKRKNKSIGVKQKTI